MSKEKDNKTPNQPPDEIKIDYDQIDVDDIMSQIREKIALAPKLPQTRSGRAQADIPGLIPPGFPEPEEHGWKSRLKKIVALLMKPFTPLIKLLVYPVYKELTETVRTLDAANKRLDFLYERHIPDLKIAVDLVDEKANNFNVNVNRRIDTAFTDIQRIKEYTKLLHNLSHNLVVELTKLKIEEENIKLKTRIMEKDFEFLSRKEKVLEKEIFQ